MVTETKSVKASAEKEDMCIYYKNPNFTFCEDYLISNFHIPHGGNPKSPSKAQNMIIFLGLVHHPNMI